MWVPQIFGEKTSSCSYLRETRSLSLNFIFLNKTFTMLNNREKRIVYSRRAKRITSICVICINFHIELTAASFFLKFIFIIRFVHKNRSILEA